MARTSNRIRYFCDLDLGFTAKDLSLVLRLGDFDPIHVRLRVSAQTQDRLRTAH